MALSFVSIIIPTLNEEKNISNCLFSIFSQDYPKNKFEVIILDRYSTDRTAEIAESYGAKVIKNNLPIEELRKPLGVKLARGELVCFIDADNILTQKDWLRRMVEPFEDCEIVGSEPLYYESKKSDNFVMRYCSYLGGDDPISIYLRMGAKWCSFLNTWTLMPHEEKDTGNYLKVTLHPDYVPAMGVNGFLLRKNALNKVPHNPFNHPLVVRALVLAGYDKFAKVKVGVVHVQKGVKNFFRRKLRRIVRRYNKEVDWSAYNYGITPARTLFVVVYALSFFLPLKDALIGAIKNKDVAWLFHPFACLGIVWLYGFYTLRMSLFSRSRQPSEHACEGFKLLQSGK